MVKMTWIGTDIKVNISDENIGRARKEVFVLCKAFEDFALKSGFPASIEVLQEMQKTAHFVKDGIKVTNDE
jgi:hypothetical protein